MLKRDSAPPGCEREFRALSFYASLESGVTNSKKIKNVRPSRGVILYNLDVGKNSTLDKSNLLESPFTKMTYHVQGCMAFRSNELDLAQIMS
jgi:hypothetical protein